MDGQPGGLQRALTWRYMLVTTVALLVVELLVILTLTRFAPPYTFGMQPDVYLMRELGEVTRDYLLADDIDGLQVWLTGLAQPVVNVTLDDDWLRLTVATFPGRNQQVTLVFREGDGVLAATPLNSPFAEIKRIEDLPGPLDSDLLLSVPAQPGNNIVTTRSDNAVLSVSPVQAADGELLALLIVLNFAPERTPSFADVLGLTLVSTLALVTVTAVLGSGFGYMASRFVVRRLHALVATTARWGLGDFSQPVLNGIAEDEISALAHHLNDLRAQIQDLLTLRERLAVVEEREHFARELHDSVKQSVFTLRMNLATVETLLAQDNDRADDHLQKSISLAQTVQDDLTLMISTFRDGPQNVDRLPERLQALVGDWSKHTEIAATVTVDRDVTTDLLTAHALIRITSEALANVYRHSGAANVDVRLTLTSSTLHLHVNDDGHGFDPAQSVGGIGLASMRERVDAIGGTLTIASGGDGTIVYVQVPTQATGGTLF